MLDWRWEAKNILIKTQRVFGELRCCYSKPVAGTPPAQSVLTASELLVTGKEYFKEILENYIFTNEHVNHKHNAFRIEYPSSGVTK